MDVDVTAAGAMPSNSLLDEQSYAEAYQRLKEQHGRQIVKQWTEKTDPGKFVYEDCGIAAYLVELWRLHGIGPRQQFVDLGCGNGLLVHLLTKLGHRGRGLDARERKIWTKFRAEGTQLAEAPFDPSSPHSVAQHLQGIDFVIGNHSDELTPWIPLVAARLRCNFFLLPCCPYDFFTKFMRQIPSKKALEHGYPKGVADQYFAFLKDICEQLGFDVQTDQLKIPSRKRKCIIGTFRFGSPAEHIERTISHLLAMANLRINNLAAKGFTPRASKEMVRNCTKLPFDYKQELTRRIVLFLIQRAPDENINGWRCGGYVSLQALVDGAITAQDRQMLDQQDKGVQTFLRNHHQIFDVQKGTVAIRRWPSANAEFVKKAQSKRVVRHTNCWFHRWHPDGCPLSADVCSFKH